MRYPESLLKLISLLRKLPGVGSKTAERFAFHLLGWQEATLHDLGISLQEIKNKIHTCPQCGCLQEMLEACGLCDPQQRQTHTLCVVASIRDVFALEETGEYRGLYQVLGAHFSPLQGTVPQPEILERMRQRILSLSVREVVLALDATLEGDATALYLKKILESLPVQVSRLALGMPVGSPFDFIDGGTLARAFAGRHAY